MNRRISSHARQLARRAFQPLGVSPCPRADPERRYRERSAALRELPLRRMCDRARPGSLSCARPTPTASPSCIAARLVFERLRKRPVGRRRRTSSCRCRSPCSGLLIHALGLDPRAPVADFVPEMKGTAYRGAKLRDLLDMRAGIVLDENYLATSGPIVEYRKATGWNPLEAGRDALGSAVASTLTQRTDGPHGGRVHYVSPNTDLLGWVIERADRRAVCRADELAGLEEAGAERSAYITVDRLGAPRVRGRHVRHAARPGARRTVADRGAGELSEDIETRRRPQGLGGGRSRAVLPRAADALPQQVVCLERRGAARLRLGHPRPAPVRRPQERDRHRQALARRRCRWMRRASRSPCAAVSEIRKRLRA